MLGRSDIFLKLEIVKKALCLVVVLSCFRMGVLTWLTISAFVIGPLGVIINSWPNKKLLDYTIGMQLRDVMPTALICCVQAGVMMGIGLLADIVANLLDIPNEGIEYLIFLAVKLILQGMLGISVFFILSYMFRLNPMGEYAKMVAVAIGGRFPRIAKALERRFDK
jgi:hypothetical protein